MQETLNDEEFLNIMDQYSREGAKIPWSGPLFPPYTSLDVHFEDRVGTRDDWEVHLWNPQNHSRFRYDPEVIEKPTWEELIATLQRAKVGSHLRNIKNVLRKARDEAVTSPIRHPTENAVTIQGYAIERFANLISKVNRQKNTPGNIWEPSIIRTTDGKVSCFNNHIEMDMFLETLEKQANIAHNIYNTIRAEVDSLEIISKSDTASDSEKSAVFTRIAAINDNLETEITTNFEDLRSPDFMTPSEESARQWGTVYIESHAAKAISDVRGDILSSNFFSKHEDRLSPLLDAIRKSVIVGKKELNEYDNSALIIATARARGVDILRYPVSSDPMLWVEPESEIINLNVDQSEDSVGGIDWTVSWEYDEDSSLENESTVMFIITRDNQTDNVVMFIDPTESNKVITTVSPDSIVSVLVQRRGQELRSVGQVFSFIHPKLNG